jgi:hypothetical protein
MAALMPAPMHHSLPPPVRQWVADQAARMGLPGADDYIVLLIRLEKQRHDLAAAACRAASTPGPEELRRELLHPGT